MKENLIGNRGKSFHQELVAPPFQISSGGINVIHPLNQIRLHVGTVHLVPNKDIELPLIVVVDANPNRPFCKRFSRVDSIDSKSSSSKVPFRRGCARPFKDPAGAWEKPKFSISRAFFSKERFGSFKPAEHFRRVFLRAGFPTKGNGVKNK
ncbi:hypothetical protein CEXT_260211 [Caerostris extrusa]|uniref:Uncharacterized protein n=1 Tax=Caerostris extrusa TaxID=172846 RepID=A0AAV4PTB9_CAEEX|nr:hypothetical protein CEXT_260211 [Caerostris extrusa]